MKLQDQRRHLLNLSVKLEITRNRVSRLAFD